MPKNTSFEPFDSLIMKSIDTMYAHGGFMIKTDCTFKLIIDSKGRLTLESINKEGMSITTTHVKKFLAILTYYSFFSKEYEDIDLIPVDISINPETRLKVINTMYNIYETMLYREPNKILEMIDCQNESVFANLANKQIDCDYSFDNFITLRNRLGKLISNYHDLLEYGYSICDGSDKSIESKEEKLKALNKKINEFNYRRRIKPVSQVRSNNVEEELTKAGIPYEIINNRNFLTNPAIGRDKEMRDVGASLLSYAVNPVLIGEPGVGKTAIIEGLAYKINRQDISEKLQGKKIIKISPSAIVSGCMYRGMFEERMQKLIDLLKDNEDYILYIDEIHTAYKTGSSADGDNDILNILKPYIENGSIKIIGATTNEEYDDVLLRDRAFTRRIRPITITEPNIEALIAIIDTNIVKYEKTSGIPFVKDNALKNSIIDILISVTSEKNRTYNEKRYNPALVLSIIEQAFGYALYDQKEFVGTPYIIESLNGCESIYASARNSAIAELNKLETISIKPKIIELKPIKRT